MHGYFRSSIKISTGRARVANRFQSGGFVLFVKEIFPRLQVGHDKKLASNWIASRKFLQILQQALIKVRNEGFITIRRFFFFFLLITQESSPRSRHVTSISCSKFVRHRMLITGTFLWPNTSINLHLKFQHRQVWSVAGISRRSDVVARVKKKLG